MLSIALVILIVTIVNYLTITIANHHEKTYRHSNQKSLWCFRKSSPSSIHNRNICRYVGLCSVVDCHRFICAAIADRKSNRSRLSEAVVECEILLWILMITGIISLIAGGIVSVVANSKGISREGTAK